MTAYRLSALRSKGWIRLSLAASVAMIPFTAMEHARGIFSEGPRGVEQAFEFFAGGVSLALIFGLSAAWVAHGFAVKARDSEEDEEESPRRPASGLGGGGGRPPAAAGHPPAHGAHPAHPGVHAKGN